MGMKGKDQPALPIRVHSGSQGDHLAHHGITILQGEGEVAGQGGDGIVPGHILGGLAPVDEDFGAGADGRDDGFNQHLAEEGAGMVSRRQATCRGAVK